VASKQLTAIAENNIGWWWATAKLEKWDRPALIQP